MSLESDAMPKSAEKILVTGAGGYVGAVLVPYLLEEGYLVRAVDRFFFGQDLLKNHPSLEIIKDDTRCLQQGWFKNIDYVIDLAAISNDPSGEYFQKETYEINRDARIACANFAKTMGVKRYILPSSCSVYGFHSEKKILSETDKVSPLTTYADANAQAEIGVLNEASQSFSVVVLRQATLFGLSPRMRFDLAVNGMTHGAWKDRKLPLLRDGRQWRPMLHVKDAARAQLFAIRSAKNIVEGQIYNTGSDNQNYQIGDLAKQIAVLVGNDVNIDFYGEPDHRSYRVSFTKISSIGFNTTFSVADGVVEILEALNSMSVEKTDKSITLLWYTKLEEWNELIKDLKLYDGIVSIDKTNTNI